MNNIQNAMRRESLTMFATFDFVHGSRGSVVWNRVQKQLVQLVTTGRKGALLVASVSVTQQIWRQVHPTKSVVEKFGYSVIATDESNDLVWFLQVSYNRMTSAMDSEVILTHQGQCWLHKYDYYSKISFICNILFIMYTINLNFMCLFILLFFNQLFHTIYLLFMNLY